MRYYTIRKTFFVDCYTSNVEQSQKIDNYKYLDVHNIKNFVKYFTWQGNVSGQNPSQYRHDVERHFIRLLKS